ncbi:MAG: hypothetical protein ACE5KM_10240 [Planctomycetaceae bacterium]
MSYEVVYTSSPSGLREGDRGFCTIAATTGIPRLLREKLESFSGYRHAFPASSRRNPVNYCHRIVRIQGMPFFVLSRIADAGIDYSGRNNKIAHHLALSAADVRSTKSTPCALLGDPEFWFTEWSGEAKVLPAGRVPSARRSRGTDCGSWKSAFGDAGWAGVLAGAVQDDIEPVAVIVPNGTDALALVHEAMSLVPAGKRWQIGFSTYYTRSTSGSECHWRFLLDGTEEAKALRRDERSGIVVDPLNDHGLTEDDVFVEAARSGDVSAIRKPASREGPAEERLVASRPVTRSQIRRRQAGARARRARLAAKARPVYRRERELPPLPPPESRSRRPAWVWWAVAAGVLAVSVVSFIIVWAIGSG